MPATRSRPRCSCQRRAPGRAQLQVPPAARFSHRRQRRAECARAARARARTEPNLSATTIELYAGLDARSVNCFPSVEFDLRAINGLASSILVAGFYNKTFKWPKSFWKKILRAGPARRRRTGRSAGRARPGHLRPHALALRCPRSRRGSRGPQRGVASRPEGCAR